jgi:hypothetical protein
MKLTFLVSILIFINNSYASALELTPNNLTLYALKHSNNEIINAYAKQLTMKKKSKEYFKYIKDKSKRDELIEATKNELIKEASFINDPQKFLISQTVELQSLEKKDNYKVTKFLRSNIKSILRSESKTQGFPDYYYLLFSNKELLKDFKIPATLFENFKDKNIKYNSKSVFLEMTLSILKYQNNQDFQVVINEFSLYTDPTKNHLIVTIKENKKPADIIQNWFLADGFTNRLIGLHSFSAVGYRLQDNLLDVISIKDHCKKTRKINQHQLIVCETQLSDSTQRIVTYVGGKVAQVEIVALKIVPKKERDLLLQNLSSSLNISNRLLNTEPLEWDQYASEFMYNPHAFNYENSLLENFKDFKHLSTSPSSKVIFSMISKATKELLNEIN